MFQKIKNIPSLYLSLCLFVLSIALFCITLMQNILPEILLISVGYAIAIITLIILLYLWIHWKRLSFKQLTQAKKENFLINIIWVTFAFFWILVASAYLGYISSLFHTWGIFAFSLAYIFLHFWAYFIIWLSFILFFIQAWNTFTLSRLSLFYCVLLLSIFWLFISQISI